MFTCRGGGDEGIASLGEGVTAAAAVTGEEEVAPCGAVVTRVASQAEQNTSPDLDRISVVVHSGQ